MTQENVWPEYLMIRDTGLYDDMGGGGQRIYTTAGRGYEKRKYVLALPPTPSALVEAEPLATPPSRNDTIQLARDIAADAFDKSHGGRMAVSQRMRDGKADDHEMVQCAVSALSTLKPEGEPAAALQAAQKEIDAAQRRASDAEDAEYTTKDW